MKNATFILIRKFSFLFYLLLITTNSKAQSKIINSNEKDLNIPFEKEITSELEASGGTMHMSLINDYLVLHDSHVSAHTIQVLDINSGKSLWIIKSGVLRYFIYNDQLLLEFNNYTAIHDVQTGKELYKIPGLVLSYNYSIGDKLDDGRVMATMYGVPSIYILFLKDYISAESIKPAHLFQIKDGYLNQNLIGYDHNEKALDGLLETILINDKDATNAFGWYLNKEKREFIWKSISSDSILVAWKMDNGKRLPTNEFSSYPNPDNLITSVHHAGNIIFLYEEYTSYRWSWGRGTNRITAIDDSSGKILYQRWGQEYDTSAFSKFYFFDNVILFADNIMHFQDAKGKFQMYDYKSNELKDTLPVNATLFKQYKNRQLLGFTYHRNLIEAKESNSIYKNTIEIFVWSPINNNVSNSIKLDFKDIYNYDPYVFPEKDLIILYHYDKAKARSIIRVYKIIY